MERPPDTHRLVEIKLHVTAVHGGEPTGLDEVASQHAVVSSHHVFARVLAQHSDAFVENDVPKVTLVASYCLHVLGTKEEIDVPHQILWIILR